MQQVRGPLGCLVVPHCERCSLGMLSRNGTGLLKGFLKLLPPKKFTSASSFEAGCSTWG